MRCIALEDGHYGGVYRAFGAEFSVPDADLYAKSDKMADGSEVPEHLIGRPKDGSTWYQSKATYEAEQAMKEEAEDDDEPKKKPKPAKEKRPLGAGPAPGKAT